MHLFNIYLFICSVQWSKIAPVIRNAAKRNQRAFTLMGRKKKPKRTRGLVVSRLCQGVQCIYVCVWYEGGKHATLFLLLLCTPQFNSDSVHVLVCWSAGIWFGDFRGSSSNKTNIKAFLYTSTYLGVWRSEQLH